MAGNYLERIVAAGSRIGTPLHAPASGPPPMPVLTRPSQMGAADSPILPPGVLPDDDGRRGGPGRAREDQTSASGGTTPERPGRGDPAPAIAPRSAAPEHPQSQFAVPPGPEVSALPAPSRMAEAASGRVGRGLMRPA